MIGSSVILAWEIGIITNIILWLIAGFLNIKNRKLQREVEALNNDLDRKKREQWEQTFGKLCSRN